MTEDVDEKGMRSDDLTKEEKIDKLEKLCDQVGLDIEEVADGGRDDFQFSGEVTFHLEDEDGNVKLHEEFEFE